MSNYPKSKHSHVIPRCMLRGFADTDLRTCMHLVPDGRPRDGRPRVVGIRDAGVLRDFYRRTRPDGTPIYDIEWSLGHIERAAAPLLSDLASRWPLTNADRAILAEFVAVQLLRGQRFREWHRGQAESGLDEIARAGVTTPAGEHWTAGHLGPVISRMRATVTSDTHRLTRMLSLAPRASAVFGSMRWTLLTFRRPLLALSDHPVTVRGAAAIEPVGDAFQFQFGLLQAMEVRVPINAHQALVMSWADEPDPSTPVPGKSHHVRMLNTTTIAQARYQWFARPGVNVPRGANATAPISVEIDRAYNADHARSSHRRCETARLLKAAGAAGLATEYEMVTVTAGTLPNAARQ